MERSRLLNRPRKELVMIFVIGMSVSLFPSAAENPFSFELRSASQRMMRQLGHEQFTPTSDEIAECVAYVKSETTRR